MITDEIPPLRERPEDIHSLVRHFVRKYARYYRRPIVGVDKRVYEFLSACDFGGNVRELENTIRQILAFKSTGDEIVLSDIPESLWKETKATGRRKAVPRVLVESACAMIEHGQLTLSEFVAECERQVLAGAIERSGGSNVGLADRLGLSRRTLYNKRRKYRL